MNAKSGALLASADSLTKTADSVNDVAAQIAYTAVGLAIAYFTAGAGVGLVTGAIEAFELRFDFQTIQRGGASILHSNLSGLRTAGCL